MANGNPLMPTTGEQPEKRFYNYLPFFDDLDRQMIAAAFLDQAAAGQQSQFQRAGFYDALAEAQRVGRGIAGQQQSLADILAARARGEGTSLAELQLQQTLEANRRAAAGALSAAGRGINPALAQRLLLQQQSTLGQQAAGQGAILRAQEQLAAQQALGQQLGTMSGAEQAQFSSAGQLGLGQEKLGVETQEAQRQRELDVALANQRAEQERQRLQQVQEQQIQEASAEQREAAGEAAVEAGKFAAKGAAAGLFAQGGKVEAKKQMPKAKIIAAHAAAKKAIPDFKKQYGEKGEGIAYATMMKAARENKLAEGDLAKLDNEKNDVVPAMLSPGEAVIPRSIMMSPKPAAAAAKFVDALLKNKDKADAKAQALKVALGKKK